MIKKNLLLLLLLFVLQISYAQKQIKIIQPKLEFDIKLATEMLNTGNAEIRGKAFYEGKTLRVIKFGDRGYARAGTVVFLYPLTPYIEEYLELKKRNKEGKQLATISPLANCYRIESKVYSENGEFVFPGLKAGKYYLETEINEDVFHFNASEIVEIKNENEKVDCKLKYTYHI